MLVGTIVGACLASILILVFGRSQELSPNVHGQERVKAFPNEDFNASIVQLLAHRDKYHGKRVQVSGYLHVRFEDSAIYLSKEDAEYGMTKNGFWVLFDKSAVPLDRAIGPTQFDGKYVLVEGEFNKNSLGHLSAWQGTIEGINRVLEKKKRE